jgi:hypothetical protein
MNVRKVLAALAAFAAAGVLAGCGHSTRSPSAAHLPLVPGSSVIVKVRECNHGANAYCSIEMVVQGQAFENPKQLLFKERDYLHHLGWTPAGPDTGVELAAESPGHKWRVTYATALQDLKSIDLGWIARAPAVAHALDQGIFDRVPTMSVLLEVGSA